MARADASVLGIVGTGVQAYLQALAAAGERPIRKIRIWGRTFARAARVAEALHLRRPDLVVEVAHSLRETVTGADVVVTATGSTEALIHEDWLRSGVHITAVGADDARKHELAPEVLARADAIVVDCRELASRFGDIAHALRAGAITAAAVTAELGQLLNQTVAGRTCDDAITVCKLVGLGVQDLAAAEVALVRLTMERQGTPPASVMDL
jgi:ornithine cyclodeaminase